MKAFVTGATGFIGRHLIDRLLAQGHDVWALVRDPAKAADLERQNVRTLRGDLFSIPPLPGGIDLVFHLAGCTRSLKSELYYSVNRDGTASLCRALEAAAPPGLKLIVLSSLAAGGPSREGRPIRESDPPQPVSAYGWSKLFGEQEALKYRDRFQIVILRPSAVYGPGDRDFVEYFRLIKELAFPVVTKQKVASMCYVKDATEAIALCARAGIRSGEIINIAAPGAYNWEQVGDEAVRAMGVRTRKVGISLGVLYLGSVASEVRSRLTGNISLFSRDKYRELTQSGWVADTSKARETLGFEARTPLEAGMRETIAWYVERGWL